jgi:hypothetical protein
VFFGGPGAGGGGSVGSAGSANTGGGGGGEMNGGVFSYIAGAGGSGIIIFRYTKAQVDG